MATLAEAARELGVDVRSLQRYRQRGAPIPGGRGAQVDVAAVAKWMAEQGLDGATGRPFGALTGSVSTGAKAEVIGQGATADDVAAAAAAVERDLDEPGDSEGVTAALKRKLAEAELRKRVAAASRAELELARSRGDVLLASEVQQGRLARIAACRRGLLALPARLARLNGVPEGLEAEARTAVEALLEEFSRG